MTENNFNFGLNFLSILFYATLLLLLFSKVYCIPNEESGVSSAGLRTQEHPAAKAAEI